MKCVNCPPKGLCDPCRSDSREYANARWKKFRAQHRCGRCGRKVRKRRFKLPHWKRYKTVYPAECPRCAAKTKAHKERRDERYRDPYKPI